MAVRSDDNDAAGGDMGGAQEATHRVGEVFAQLHVERGDLARVECSSALQQPSERSGIGDRALGDHCHAPTMKPSERGGDAIARSAGHETKGKERHVLVTT